MSALEAATAAVRERVHVLREAAKAADRSPGNWSAAGEWVLAWNGPDSPCTCDGAFEAWVPHRADCGWEPIASPLPEVVARHVALHDPAAVLAQCDAVERLLWRAERLHDLAMREVIDIGFAWDATCSVADLAAVTGITGAAIGALPGSTP